jgi:lipid A 4'-phosphatase
LSLTDEPPLTGFTFGGRVQGWLAEPIVQCLIAIVVVSAIFLAIPAIDIWFTGLFAANNRGGFPVGTLPFFQFLRAINQWLSAIIPVTLIILVIVKIARPDRPSIVPPAKTLFILATQALGPGIVVNLILKGNWGRPRPNDVALFGQGDLPFVPPWYVTNYCPGNCSFVSGEGSSAIWLLSLAVLVPKQWRMTAIKGIVAFAVAASLNRIAFGGHYLSDVLIAWGLTLLIMAVVYRYVIERPLPWFENGRLEADLTRLGVWIRKRLGFPTPALETPTTIDVMPPPAPLRTPPADFTREREARPDVEQDAPLASDDGDARPVPPAGEEPPRT